MKLFKMKSMHKLSGMWNTMLLCFYIACLVSLDYSPILANERHYRSCAWKSNWDNDLRKPRTTKCPCIKRHACKIKSHNYPVDTITF